MPSVIDPSAARRSWRLDPAVAYLNHGSFGACPLPVLEAQRAWQDRMEADPVRFLGRELPTLLGDVRQELAAFLGADPAGLVFVPNATTGVSTVLASLGLRPGDELLATDHEYNATLNALRRTAETKGARVVLARIPFPIDSALGATGAILDAVTPRTRLVLLSHVTSPTALVLPVDAIVGELAARGIDVLVDGAHAPGQVPVGLDRLGAAWYTGNAHKWLCAPKGAAFLWARADRRDQLRPLVTSHGANDPDPSRSRLHREFDWTGTDDPSALLAIPAALRFLEGLHVDGWPGLMAAGHRRALEIRGRLCRVLGVEPPAPDPMLGAMAAVPAPGLSGAEPDRVRAIRGAMRDDDLVEVGLTDWPVRAAHPVGSPPASWLVRASGAPYTSDPDVDRLIAAVGRRLARDGMPGLDPSRTERVGDGG